MNTPLEAVSPAAEPVAFIPQWADEAVKKQRKERHTAQKRIKDQQRFFDLLRPYIEPVEIAINAFTLPEASNVRFQSYTVDAYSWGARISVFLKDITAWRELIPLFDALDGIGIPSDSWENTDLPDSYTRAYETTLTRHPDTNEVVTLIIYAHLKSDASDCRRIVVGWTKGRVEQPAPIYAFDCADDPKTPAPQPAAEPSEAEPAVEAAMPYVAPSPSNPDNDIPF